MYGYIRHSQKARKPAYRRHTGRRHTQPMERKRVRAADFMRSPLDVLFCLLFAALASASAALLLSLLVHSGLAGAQPIRSSPSHTQRNSTANPSSATALLSSFVPADRQAGILHSKLLHAADLSSQRSALSLCPAGSHAYVVVADDTLPAIAARFGTTWMALSSYNQLADPGVIQVRQVICIPITQVPPAPLRPSGIFPTAPSSQDSSHGAVGTANLFHYGQCTWWADERYHELHGVLVPWMTNSNAWTWTQRAYEFGWHVSSTPSAGAIIDLQPWVQGAYGLGHVAVVEAMLPNNHVLASTMGWSKSPFNVQDVEFTPGPGVTFISS